MIPKSNLQRKRTCDNQQTALMNSCTLRAVSDSIQEVKFQATSEKQDKRSQEGHRGNTEEESGRPKFWVRTIIFLWAGIA